MVSVTLQITLRWAVGIVIGVGRALRPRSVAAKVMLRLAIGPV